MDNRIFLWLANSEQLLSVDYIVLIPPAIFGRSEFQLLNIFAVYDQWQHQAGMINPVSTGLQNLHLIPGKAGLILLLVKSAYHVTSVALPCQIRGRHGIQRRHGPFGQLIGGLPLLSSQGCACIRPYHGLYVVSVALEQLLRNMNLRAGISQRLSELTDANEGFAQAQMAVEMPQKLDLKNNFHTYDSVALYHMIQSSKSKIRDYHTFMHRAIAILKKFDAENHQELLYTLYVYLRESQKAIKAAEILCIHKNTLFYRLRKIREITGIDLDRSDEVLHLQISFLILRYEGELMA